MNLYVDQKALFKYTDKLKEIFKQDNKLHVKCILNNKYAFRKAYFAIKKNLSIHQTYIVDYKKLSSKIIKYHNNGKMDLMIDVFNTIKNGRKIKKISKAVNINDVYLNRENLEIYNLNNKCIHNWNVKKAIGFDLSYLNQTNLTCHFSSCLGNMLYLNKNGNFYFCFYNQDKSYLCNIKDVNNIEEIFNSNNFIEILDSSIKKRYCCKNDCNYFAKCNGGCPLGETHCDDFIKNLEKAINIKNDILKNQDNLNDYPIYVKSIILKEVCKINIF